MRLASRPLDGDPISPRTRRVAALLAREKTGEILARLRNHPYLSASELARTEHIHVATAQRYLRELQEADLVGVRRRRGSTRPTEEYWLREPHIRIDIDLERTPGVSEDELVALAKRLGVRDSGHENVVYDTHPETGIVQGLLILSEQQPRLVSKRLGVPLSVGRFLSRLPIHGAPPVRVWDLMQQAGLGIADLPTVLAALGRFSPAAADGPEGEPAKDVPEGSARPVDPSVKRVFEELAVSHDNGSDGPSVRVVDVTVFEPESPRGGDTDDDDDQKGPDDPRVDDPDETPPMEKTTPEATP